MGKLDGILPSQLVYHLISPFVPKIAFHFTLQSFTFSDAFRFIVTQLVDNQCNSCLLIFFDNWTLNTFQIWPDSPFLLNEHQVGGFNSFQWFQFLFYLLICALYFGFHCCKASNIIRIGYVNLSIINTPTSFGCHRVNQEHNQFNKGA